MGNSPAGRADSAWACRIPPRRIDLHAAVAIDDPTSLCFSHKLVEPADLAILRLLLIQEFETGFVKLLEELVPADLLQSLIGLRLGEVDPQNAGFLIISPGPFDGRRLSAPFLDPVADRVVVGRG